ncbi:hypothetical protein FTUN_3595 [Frigoriglobus tundricola]|uniref:Uncharacterized protein n=1 Tax=Frigoriglobus tundricola TaxID=2774151 RepID=A0A6M5YS01_9BACT|nr:hypothetical protein FTUN_3595 [Frigoriglobus tundricola]
MVRSLCHDSPARDRYPLPAPRAECNGDRRGLAPVTAMC